MYLIKIMCTIKIKMITNVEYIFMVVDSMGDESFGNRDPHQWSGFRETTRA